MNGWIGVDLDGTLAYYDEWRGIEHVGEPIKPMCDRVRSWLADGCEVRIFTARVSQPEQGLEGVFEDRSSVEKPINEFCLREFGRILKVTNVKDFGMVELWDDRAVQVVFNTGEEVGFYKMNNQ